MKRHVQAAQDKVNSNAAPWIGGLGILIAVLSFLAAFLFNEVVAAPKTYTTIEQHQRDVDKINERQTRIEDKIDKGFDRLHETILDLHKE